MAGFLGIGRMKVLTPVEGYDRWASSYLQETNPIKKLSDDMVEQMLPSLDGKTVLDAGCGPVKFCVYASNHNARAVSGIDSSPKMIEEARKACPSATFTAGDLLTVSLPPASYDVVICALVLGHIQKLKPVLEKLIDTLGESGTMIITDFHPFLTLMQEKRTFRDPVSGKQFEVRHYLHLFEEYFASFISRALSIEQWAEPQFNDTPVVFGVRLRKQ